MEHKRNVSDRDPCTDRDIGDRFPDYLDGLLKLEEAQKIEKHVKICAQCRLELDIWLSAMGKYPPSSGAWSDSELLPPNGA